MRTIEHWDVTRAIATVMTLTFVAPSTVRSQTAEPETGVSPEWVACERDDDCTSVTVSCCACGSGDYIGVHRDHRGELSHLVAPDCDAVRCPAMDCPRLWDSCRGGACVVQDEPSPAQIERERIELLVFNSQRAGFERHDVEAYLSIFAEDARMVAARGAQEGPYDWSMNRQAFEASRRLQLSGPAELQTMGHESLGFDVDGDTAELRVRTTLRAEAFGEVVEEIFRLRRGDDGTWQVVENRWWPVSNDYGDGPLRHSETTWAEADAEVEAAREGSDAQVLVFALQRAYRFPEAYAVLQSLTEEADAQAHLWKDRGDMAVLTGHAEDGLAAFRRARELDPTISVPSYAE